jgi:hypothetical protein
LAGFDEMTLRYDIIELCTAVKAAAFVRLFAFRPELEQIHYLDPDTLLCAPPHPLTGALESASILLTPHHLTPLPIDGRFPDETLALNHGIYNLGYLGLRRSPDADALLAWWSARLLNHCRIDLGNGLFVDQLWMNYAPLYFPNVAVLRHPGVNTAYWNLHEREILPGGKIRHAGREHDLILYHFSGFSPSRRDRLTRAELRQNLESLPALAELARTYAVALVDAGHESARKVECVYVTRRREHLARLEREFVRRHPWRAFMKKIRRSVPEPLRALFRP